MIGKPVGNCLFSLSLLDRRPDSQRRLGQAGFPNRVHGGQLRIAQPGNAQCVRRLLSLSQPVFKQRRAALNGRSGIIQFVSQACRELAQRYHLLVLQVAGSKEPRTIEHNVHQYPGHLKALAGQRLKLVPGNRQYFGGFFRDGISRGIHHPRIRQHATHFACSPFNDFLRPGASIDRQRNVPRQHDIEALNRSAFVRQHPAGIQLSQRPVRRQPGKFLPGRCTQRLVLRKPIDQVQCGHP